jgi:hypothetical protein
MPLHPWSRHVLALAAAASLTATTASAGTITYAFNANPGLGWTVANIGGVSGTSPTAWEWSGGPSVDEGGWHSRRGAEAPVAATTLVSPYFQVDNVGQHYVRMELLERYNFPTLTGTVPVALGQVQFNINNGPWLGIRTADYTQDANHHYPTYDNPPTTSPETLLDSTTEPAGYPAGGWPVQALAGTTPFFADGKHHDSTFTLPFPPDGAYTFGPGDWLRFRFVMAIQQADTGTPQINWEINKLQIDGISAVAVPEPTGVTLAGIGAVLGGVLLRHKRRGGTTRTS